MAIRGNSRTLAAAVYDQLRDQILSGWLPPGTRLRPSRLRPEFGVSAVVVREASPASLNSSSSSPSQILASPARRSRGRTCTTSSNTAPKSKVSPFVFSVTQGDLDMDADVMSAHHKRRLHSGLPRT